MFEQLANGVGPFKWKFHQIAFYTPRFDTALDRWWDLGFRNWSHDRAVLKGVLNHSTVKDEADWEEIETNARMAFNYDIFPKGVEVELLAYQGPLHEWKVRGKDAGEPFLSHLSIYTEDLAGETEHVKKEWGIEPYHLFTTEQHENPRVKGKKRFNECIFDMKDVFGYDVKFIEKVDWNYMPDYRYFMKQN